MNLGNFELSSLWIYFHLTAIFATQLRILSRDNMDATTRLAWFLVIVSVPLVGVVLYFLFGEVNLGKRFNRRTQEVNALVAKASLAATADTALVDGNILPDYRPIFDYAKSINQFQPTLGNTAELMPDAASARARLLEDLANAKKTINVLYYIWLDDDTGTNLADALISAAHRGVCCRVMADALGSRTMVKSKLWQEMKDAGVITSTALPFRNIIKTLALSRLDLRNHRKITVIDNHITYCGSQNCADPEFRVKARFAPWVDIMVRLEGPVAAQNQLLFAGDWLLHNEGSIESFETETPLHAAGIPAQVWGDGPTSRHGTAQQMFATLIGQARHKLTISTPYFVPGDVVLDALCASAYRGVDVTIIFPAKNDSFVVAAASHSHYGEMLRAGIKIFEFEPGLLHAKTLTIDGVITLIGSSNLDRRSFNLNYENNIILQDQTTTQSICERQKEYISASHAVILEDIQAWSLPRRIWQNVIATIGPVL